MLLADDADVMSSFKSHDIRSMFILVEVQFTHSLVQWLIDCV